MGTGNRNKEWEQGMPNANRELGTGIGTGNGNREWGIGSGK